MSQTYAILPPMNNFMIIPVGAPASGKSTLRRWLVEHWFDPDGIVCPDDYRRVLTGGHEIQTSNDAVFKIADMITKERLRNGLNVYVDATNLHPRRRDELFNMVSASTAKLILVLFDTPRDECFRRNSRRIKPVPNDVMKRMCDSAENITKFTLRREAGDCQVYTPDQFMSYSWEFLKAL